METDQQAASAAAAPEPAPAAPQEVEEIIKKKRTKKSNVNFSSQTAGMPTEQLQVRHMQFLVCWSTLFSQLM